VSSMIFTHEKSCLADVSKTVYSLLNTYVDTRATERYHTPIILMSFVSHDDLNNDESKWGGREEMKCVAAHAHAIRGQTQTIYPTLLRAAAGDRRG
jgi:hypothetical protein